MTAVIEFVKRYAVLAIVAVAATLIVSPSIWQYWSWQQEAQAQVTITNNAQSIMNGRCTLQTVTPVMVTSATSATTTYFTPYNGNIISLYDGNRLVPTEFAELSNATAASSVGNAGPAVVVSGSNYDLFVWGDTRTGTKYLTRGPLWTSDTVRSMGLSRVKGVLVNGAAITNGPAVNRGTYVCSERTSADLTVNWQMARATGGWGPGNYHLWNAYNRVPVYGFTGDSAASWTYGTAVVREAGGTVAARVSFLQGLSEDGVSATYSVPANVTTGRQAEIGIGLDTITLLTVGTQYTSTSSTDYIPMSTTFSGLPGLGFHYLSPNEFVSNTSVVFVGSTTRYQTGMSFTGRF